MNKTFIIAEAGVNHNGSLEIAKALIAKAKQCGADAVKFQTFCAERLVAIGAEKTEYQKKTTEASESQYAMLKRLELSEADHRELIQYCQTTRILFLSSPFDEESADLLECVGVEQYKIPSGEMTNHPYLRHVAGKGKPIILSTGMSTLGEMEEALDVFYAAGNKQITLLHCVTEYPAPAAEINLRAILTMKQAFGLPVGYSDHTLGIEIAIAAVVLGAEVIEKHFTLDKTMEGPDHQASLEPTEFHAMVTAIRNVENALGTGIKKPAPCELKNIDYVRKSIIAKRDIKKGEVFNADNLIIKRPGKGISPTRWDEIVGQFAQKNFNRDEYITITN